MRRIWIPGQITVGLKNNNCGKRQFTEYCTLLLFANMAGAFSLLETAIVYIMLDTKKWKRHCTSKKSLSVAQCGGCGQATSWGHRVRYPQTAAVYGKSSATIAIVL